MEDLTVLWFYLEPYVFISEDDKGFLFYDTYHKKGLSVDKSERVSDIVRYLQTPEHMYSISVSVKDLEDEQLYNFIQSMQEGGYGDLLEGELPKPVIMPPLLNLQKSVERMKKNDLLIGENIMSYLHEVTIYINGECTQKCSECRNLFKQLPCCTQTEHTLDFNSLNDFLHSIAYTRTAINITGGNPFQYPDFHKLLDVLGRRASLQTFIVNYRNIPDDSDMLYIFTNESFRLKIIVNDSYQVSSLVTIAGKLKHGNIRQRWEIYISSISEYEKAKQLTNQLSDQDIEAQIKPFYNKKNRDFFEEYVFVNQEDILTIELDRQSVFALQALNVNNFGKITVLSDGKVYANVNTEPLGNICEPIYHILCKEHERGASWRNTRYNTGTCNQCRFKLLCPSPSNYELAIGKPNLCHVRP
jgi:pseudo-rSAM protein